MGFGRSIWGSKGFRASEAEGVAASKFRDLRSLRLVSSFGHCGVL